MNKTVKKALFTVFIIVLITGATFAIRFKMEMKRFNTLTTGQRLEGVYALNAGISNMFLLPDTNGTFIAVDAGSNMKLIIESLKKLKIDPNKVTTILCTHTDYDHTCGIPAFPNAKVIISEDEKQMVDGRTARSFGFVKNSLPVHYSTIVNKTEFSTGSHRITGILTPGHTPGSMCWQIDDTLLFSGDAFGIENGKAGLFSKLFNMNSEQQIRSIDNVARISGLKHVFTAHNGQSDNVTVLFNQK
jgi:hydroxyacylglutathione hydrolase